MKKIIFLLIFIGMICSLTYAADEKDNSKTREKTSNQMEKANKSFLASEVIWAAVIASLITFSGVALSNRSNRRCLLLQLDKSENEKDKEQRLQIRKEIYIEVAEAIQESLTKIAMLSNKVVQEGNIEFNENLSQVVAKVYLVGSIDTVRKTVEFMKKYNEISMKLVPEIAKCLRLKQGIISLTNLSNSQINLMKEINANFAQLNETQKNKQDAVNAFRTDFQNIKSKHDVTVSSLYENEEKLKKAHIAFVSMCIEAYIDIQDASQNILLSIRKELNLDIDSDDFLFEMKSMNEIYKGRYTPEELEKFINDS